MSTSESLFSMVGYRFVRLAINEISVNSAETPTIALDVVVTLHEPRISETKFSDRLVVELELSIEVEITKDVQIDESEGSRNVVSAMCVAGFIANDQTRDGDLEEFKPAAPTFARAIYWLARQRIMSLLTMTKLRNFQLPWEVGAYTAHSVSENYALPEK